MDFYVDDIEAAVADLRARGVVFEQYDGAVNGIMDITPRSGHLTSDHKGHTHMPMWYRVLSAGYTLSVSMAM